MTFHRSVFEYALRDDMFNERIGDKLGAFFICLWFS